MDLEVKNIQNLITESLEFMIGETGEITEDTDLFGDLSFDSVELVEFESLIRKKLKKTFGTINEKMSLVNALTQTTVKELSEHIYSQLA